MTKPKRQKLVFKMVVHLKFAACGSRCCSSYRITHFMLARVTERVMETVP